MTYKSIFTALATTEATPPELTFAATMAQTLDAHLEVLCLGVDRTPLTYFEVGSNAVMMHAAIEEAHARAAEIRITVDKVLAPYALRWDCLSSVAPTAGVGRVVASQARFADLAVVGLPYGAGQPPEASLVLESLLFESDCPCIVVPQGTVKARPRQIVIAWNESNEAMRAVKAALPLLKAARAVHIAVVDPPTTGPERSDPGGALALYLSRHQVRSDINVMTCQGMSVSERLARHVLETGADMLVMGGYGHSRLREAVLGGATRDMLQDSAVPILMAH